ncbi:MAG: AraC family transcriptional regulator [Deltaproteobacteria bacterium]|nr:AraC family transcriptional regulator [Deltaproteobacteria bacterium]
MDALSQILSSVELQGSLYFPTLFRAHWGLQVPANTAMCRFHVVVEGRCLIGADGEEAWLGTGDLALVPHGREHTLQDDPETPLVHLEEALEAKKYGGEGLLEWGETGARTRLVCGHFAFDNEATHPLLEALPSLVHLEATPSFDFRWIDQVMRFMGEEMHSQQPGSELIAQRLSEILFVQVMRHYGQTAEAPISVLAALTDSRLSRVFSAMHTDLKHPWQLEELAELSGMSRTSFAQRFSEQIGLTPMKYLLKQRIDLACKLLRSGARSAEVASRVGYRSEAAFARKFKEEVGVGPGLYRKNNLARNALRPPPSR